MSLRLSTQNHARQTLPHAGGCHDLASNNLQPASASRGSNGKSFYDSQELPCKQLFALFDALRLDDGETRTYPALDAASQQRTLDLLDHQLASDENENHMLVQIHERQIQPALESLLPSSLLPGRVDSGTIGQRKSTSRFSARLKLLLYSASNNLAGVDGAGSPSVMYQFLRPMISVLLKDRHGCMPLSTRVFRDVPSSRPMAEMLFISAIEAGDHEIIEGLLRCPDAGIDVNNLVCIVDEAHNGPLTRVKVAEGSSPTSHLTKYTPVERAAALQHVAITMLLVEFGADIEKTHLTSNEEFTIQSVTTFAEGGALSSAIFNSLGGQVLNKHLVQGLLSAGSCIKTSTLRLLLALGFLDLVEALISAHLDKKHQELLKSGILHEAVYKMSATSVLSLIDRLQALRMNFDYDYVLDYQFSYGDLRYEPESEKPFPLWQRPAFPPRMLDIAAQRGEIGLLQRLRGYGANVTADTMTAAIMSGKENIVKFCLYEGASVQCYSPHYRSSAFGQLVLSKQSGLQNLLQIHACMVDLQDDRQSCVALAAVAAVGDIEILSDLLERKSDWATEALGYALTQAVEGDHNMIAEMLLNYGASVSPNAIVTALGHDSEGDLSLAGSSRMMLPLCNAMFHGNAALVRILLDHGAWEYENRCLSPRSENTFQEWVCEAALDQADLQMIVDLHDACAFFHINHGLEYAVKKQNQAMLRNLLEISESHAMGVIKASGALRAALLTGSSDMIRELLVLGADVSECETELLELMDGSPSLFHDCLELFATRYPRGKPGFGSRLLTMAVHLGRSELVKDLLAQNCAMGRELLNALKSAISKSGTIGPDILRALLSRGINLNTTMQGSYSAGTYTLLLFAIETKQSNVVEILLQHGANVNLPASKGLTRTPLQKAAEIGSRELVQLLLAYGADVRSPPSKRDGGTPLELAARGGQIGVAELLIKSGCDYRTPGSQVHGRIALESAAEHGRFDMVKYISNLGRHLDSQYESAIALAKSKGHTGIVEMLSSIQMRERQKAQECIQARITAAPDVQQDPHACVICTLRLSNASALRRHMRDRHESLRSYQCDVCPKLFKRPDTLKRHRDIHEQSRDQNRCTSCGKVFSRGDSLRAHMRGCMTDEEAVGLDQNMDGVELAADVDNEAWSLVAM